MSSLTLKVVNASTPSRVRGTVVTAEILSGDPASLTADAYFGCEDSVWQVTSIGMGPANSARLPIILNQTQGKLALREGMELIMRTQPQG